MVIASVLKEIKDKMRRKGCLVYLKAGRESMIEFPDGSKLRLDGDGFSLDGQILSIDIDEQPIDVFVYRKPYPRIHHRWTPFSENWLFCVS